MLAVRDLIAKLQKMPQHLLVELEAKPGLDMVEARWVYTEGERVVVSALDDGSEDDL